MKVLKLYFAIHFFLFLTEVAKKKAYEFFLTWETKPEQGTCCALFCVGDAISFVGNEAMMRHGLFDF